MASTPDHDAAAAAVSGGAAPPSGFPAAGPDDAGPPPPPPPATTIADREPAAPGAARPPHRRRRRLWLLVPVAVVLIGGGVAALLLRGEGVAPSPSPGPLTIGADVALTVTPPTGGCNTTFIFQATGSVTGAGPLVYRWEQSDGYVTPTATVTIAPTDGSYALTQAWRIQGGQALSGMETFHILAPTDHVVRRSFQYHCR